MTELKKVCRRLTLAQLDGTFAKDRGRRLKASLEPGDLLVLTPQGTRRPETISLFDVYRYAIHCRINATRMEKLRAKKAHKQEQRKQRAWARELRKTLP